MTRNNVLAKAIPAMLSLGAETSWGTITLKDIADKADLTIADFHGVADTADLSAEIEAHFDKAMTEGAFETDESPRTRLFDVIMMRFEAMEDARHGTLSYLKWRNATLSGLKARGTGRVATARWALACSGLDGNKAIPLPLQIMALARTITLAEQAWKQDTSPDLTRTMAALDAHLLKLEARAEWLTKRNAPSKQDDHQAETKDPLGPNKATSSEHEGHP
ncbi:MAG: hypothetical protein AAGG45_05535 [Pseudomonadota bacterium]